MAALSGPQTSHNIGLPKISLPLIDTQNIQISAKLRLFSHVEYLNPMDTLEPSTLLSGQPFIFKVDRWTAFETLKEMEVCIQANAWPLLHGGICDVVEAASRKGKPHLCNLILHPGSVFQFSTHHWNASSV